MELIFVQTAKMKKYNLRHIGEDTIKAALIVGVDVIISRIIFYAAVALPNIYLSFLIPGVYGCILGIVLLYLFEHDGIFHFVKLIEQKQKKKEEEFLNTFLHLGKIVSIIFITTFGGVLFGALTIRLIFKNMRYKYLLICLANIPSTLFWVALAKGIIGFIICSSKICSF